MSKRSGLQGKTVGGSLRRPVVVDLFAGAGGLSLGFEAAGYDVLAAVEYDPIHAATHLFNFPLSEVLCADVRTVTSDAIRAAAGAGWDKHYPDQEWDGVIDVVVGGPSCQGFSVMGKQDADDDRNTLVLEFVRLVEQLKPRAFCMENVPGFLDARFGSIRKSAVSRLRAAGYLVADDHKVLRAEDFGVPQRRRRVFVLGALGGSIPDLPEPSCVTPRTVDEAFAGLPELWRFVGLDATDVVKLSVAACRRLDAASNDYLLEAATRGLGDEHWGHARQDNRQCLSGCRLTVHSAKSAARFESTPVGTKEPISRFYKLDPSSPSLTLRAGTGRERGSFSAPRPLHPRQARVITVREAARLHSFPDWFRFHTTNWHGHRQIGNAVPPLLARHVASALMAALGEEPQKSARPAVTLGDAELLRMSPAVAAKHFGAAENQVPQRRRAESAA